MSAVMILTQPQVVIRLQHAVKAAGSLRAFARDAGISPAYVSLVLRRRAHPGAAVLRALRIRKLPPQYEDRA